MCNVIVFITIFYGGHLTFTSFHTNERRVPHFDRAKFGSKAKTSEDGGGEALVPIFAQLECMRKTLHTGTLASQAKHLLSLEIETKAVPFEPHE